MPFTPINAGNSGVQTKPVANTVPTSNAGPTPGFKPIVATGNVGQPSVPTQTTSQIPESAQRLMGKNLPSASDNWNTIKSAFSSGVDQIKKGFQQGQDAKNIVDAAESGVTTAAGAVNTILSPVAPIFGVIGKGADYIGDKIGSIPAIYNTVGKTYNENPGFSAGVDRGLTNTENLATIAAAGASIDPAIEATQSGISTVKDTVNNIKENSAQNKIATDRAKIQETISPKPTAKEAKLAQTQGRLVQGKEPTLFKAGTSDSILPSKKTISATDTIQRNIPGAADMNDSQLYTSLDKKITETADLLKPHLEAAPIKPETIEKINTAWDALKKEQIKTADATEEPNVRKQQQQFEERLMRSGNGNMNDLWETRKEYDDSVPDNVKQANQLSSDSLQNKKEIWLQNRAILNDAINDSQNGLGETSRKAFKDMTDMYSAKQGILSKTKVDVAKASKIQQFLEKNPKTAAILGGGSIYEIMKHLGIPLP